MNSLKYILGLPEYIEGIGNIYPVLVKDYEELMRYSPLLIMASHEQLGIDPSLPILDLLLLGFENSNDIVHSLQCLFELVLRTNVDLDFDSGHYIFSIDDSTAITNDNFHVFRQTVMKQNLLFEPKKYKSKIVQEYADKVLKAKLKNSPKISMEAMITTVSVCKGMEYSKIAEQTIYQLTADFQRIDKLIAYDTAVDYRCAGDDKIDIPYFAGDIEMFVSPYDNLFVKKDQLKTDKLLNKGGN